MTTVNTSDEKILKNDILENLVTEESAVKVYKKIYGLNNVGRTFFTSEAEVNKANDEAQKQMMQKYGAEVYGVSAQYKNQRSNGGFSATGTVGEAGEGAAAGGLISCTVQALPPLPDKFFEASEGDPKAFADSLAKFEEYLRSKAKDAEWMKKHEGDVKNFQKQKANFRSGLGATDGGNANSWNAINEMLKGDAWKDELQKDKTMQKLVDNMRNGWNAWAGKEDGAALSGGKVQKTQNGSTDWNPKQPFKINITTHFDENWYKRKYKSGILNGIMNSLLTASAARSVGSAGQSSMSGKKFDSETMTSLDKMKLDGLQWKMTNKVAKDYVAYLLGWSRKKEALLTKDKTMVPGDGNQLKPDTGLGSKFAKSALGGRGILGRLRQKIFSGGQANNTISVAFQVADWRDGWKIVNEETSEPISSEEAQEKMAEKGGKDGKGGKEGGGKGGAAGGASGGAGGGKGSPQGGKGGAAGGKGANLNDKEVNNLLSLLQRVVRLEDEVGVGPGSKGQNAKDNGKGKDNATKDAQNNDKKPGNVKGNKDGGNGKENKDNKNKDVTKEPMNESDDPFYGVFDDMDLDRRELVEEACIGDLSEVANLIDDCLSSSI